MSVLSFLKRNAMQPQGGFSGGKKWYQGDFFKLGNASLGPARVQLILAALLLYLFGIEEGPKRHVF